MSSMGNSGARSCGPIGCLVPGWMTGGAGVLKSAWMLYHFVGMSFSSRRYVVRFLSVALLAMRASFGAAPDRIRRCAAGKSALTIRERARRCQHGPIRSALMGRMLHWLPGGGE